MMMIKAAHATIGTVVLFGHQLWLGYLTSYQYENLLYNQAVAGRKKLLVKHCSFTKSFFPTASEQPSCPRGSLLGLNRNLILAALCPAHYVTIFNINNCGCLKAE